MSLLVREDVCGVVPLRYSCSDGFGDLYAICLLLGYLHRTSLQLSANHPTAKVEHPLSHSTICVRAYSHSLRTGVRRTQVCPARVEDMRRTWTCCCSVR